MEITEAELRQFIEQIETLEAEKKAVAEQIKEVMAEAKGRGYDAKTIRKVVALRRLRRDELAEQEALLETYRAAVGV